ncbi:MAG: hypothetical protein ABEJ55_05120 [Halanaeroarchaeum sp.]
MTTWQTLFDRAADVAVDEAEIRAALRACRGDRAGADPDAPPEGGP